MSSPTIVPCPDDVAVGDATPDARGDVAAPDGRDGGLLDVRTDVSAPPDAYVSEASTCVPTMFKHRVPSSATILDMEGSSRATQAYIGTGGEDIAGNWAPIYPHIEPTSGIPEGTKLPWEFTALSPPRGTSVHAIHSFASDWHRSNGGVGFALLQEFAAPLDASSYGGVSFWAKGSALTTGLRVDAPLISTTENQCTCTICNDHYHANVRLGTEWP